MIQLKNINKTYPNGVIAVEDVSFQVSKGQICCVIGTSGCGKTTILKMINRLIEPSQGQIFLDNINVAKIDPVQLRRSIGYVIQKGGLLPHMTIIENMTLMGKVVKKLKDKTFQKAVELLELVGLPVQKYGNRYPAELSGGQQQRVCIARAIMNDPPVLLMDEPFGALDPITRSHLHKELLSINRKLHKTIMIVTHDLQEAFLLGSEIILMNQGKIIQKGTKADFINNPANAFAKEFVESQLEGYV